MADSDTPGLSPVRSRGRRGSLRLVLVAALFFGLGAGAWILARGRAREAGPNAASPGAVSSPAAPEIPDALPSLAPEGRLTPSARPASPGSGAIPAPADSPMAELPELIVRVVDPEGRPVDLGELLCFRGGEARTRVMLSWPETRLRPYLGGAPELGGWTLEASQFVLDEREFGPASVGPLPAGTTSVEIRLPRGQRIEGTAMGPRGEAVVGAFIEARPAPPREGEPAVWREHTHPMVKSGPDGRFRVDGLAKGAYLLVGGETHREEEAEGSFGGVQWVGEYYGSDPVRVDAPSTGVRVPFHAGVPVDIEVVDASGRAVDGVEVGFWPRIDRPRYYSVFNAITHGGAARLGTLDPTEPGLLRLTPPGDRPDLAEREVEGWTPAIRRFALASVPTISGVVRDRRGRPLPGATVVVEVPGKDERLTMLVGQDGRFRVAAPIVGAVTLRAHANTPELLEGDPEPELSSAAVVAQAGATDVVLTVDAGVSRTVRVRAPNAERYVGQLGNVRRELPSVSRWRQEVRPGGVIELEHLAAGAVYSLFVPGPDELPPLWLERVDGVEGPLDIEPARTFPVEGRVLGLKGEPAPGVRLSLTGVGWWAYGHTREDGTFRIEHAVAFPAELQVVSTGHRRVGDAAWRSVEVVRAGEAIEMRAVPLGQRKEQR